MRRQDRNRSQRRLGLARLTSQQPQQFLRADHGVLTDQVVSDRRREEPQRDVIDGAAGQDDRHRPLQPGRLIAEAPLPDQPGLPLHAPAFIWLGVALSPPPVLRGCDHQHPVRVPDLPGHPLRPVPPLFAQPIQPGVYPLRAEE